MKESILKELIENRNRYISGQELSKKFGVSRTAIWKYIKKLKEEGFVIESVTNKGYILISSPDALYPVEIKRNLKTEFIGKEIIYLDSVDSTNNYGKELASRGFNDGILIVAEEQTKGRGRLGREWISQKGKGIWMTIMLKPDLKPDMASQVTLIAALSVLRGIKNVTDIDVMIKWPNDLVINGKKVCGILTELGAEIDIINYLCVGIGINVNSEEDDFNKIGLNTATSLKVTVGKTIDRKRLIVEILESFENLYKQFLQKGSIDYMLEEYKKHLVNLGKEVKIILKNDEVKGIAEDVNGKGHLMVRLDNGHLMEVSSGEVSVRGVYEYV
ncbi:MAG TPA: biotin--[acetyl-CoA-carboxylase] ligase [Clostridiales bacterium]|nr:biotin--[acetyl-CoA-carboxylase] ligase [Clostridiales bacterium]